MSIKADIVLFRPRVKSKKVKEILVDENLQFTLTRRGKKIYVYLQLESKSNDILAVQDSYLRSINRVLDNLLPFCAKLFYQTPLVRRQVD